MADGAIEIKVSANWDRWIRGFEQIERDVNEEATAAFRQAMEVFYQRSQQYVHILSGELIASGHIEEMQRARGQVSASLVYDAEYAIYENARGGSHAFIDRAWEDVAALFDNALPQSWEAVVKSWN